MQSIAYSGMDVHKEDIKLAVVSSFLDLEARGVRQAGDEADVIERRRLPMEKEPVLRYFRQLSRRHQVRCCYEASGCGYVLQRWLAEIGVHCDVVAPSKTPRRPGDHVKTDRRDAVKLARLYRAGELSVVHAPSSAEEGVRAFVRCRDTLVHEVVRTKNQVLKFLDRRGIRYREGKTTFGQTHWRFLEKVSFEGEEQTAYREYLALLRYKQQRLTAIEEKLEELAQTEAYVGPVGKVCCLRGIAAVGAMVLLSETFDFRRFPSPYELMGYWGFGVNEDSSADKRVQGKITKAGNTRCRFIVVEAGWHYRHAPAIGERLKRRQEGQPAEVIAHAWKAQERLHQKFWRVANATGCQQKAAVAVGRELSGFVWAIMTDNCH